MADIYNNKPNWLVGSGVNIYIGVEERVVKNSFSVNWSH